MVVESKPPEKRMTAGALGLRGAIFSNAAVNVDMGITLLLAEAAEHPLQLLYQGIL